MFFLRRTRIAFVCMVLPVFGAVLFMQQPAWAAKNIILMISDGGGYNHWLAASMYRGKAGQETYERPEWRHFGCSTYPLALTKSPKDNTQQVPILIYDPAKAWNTTPTTDKLGKFLGYVYLQNTCTDSAAAATALSSGQKTYNGALNWSDENKPLKGQTIAEIAKANGKSVGVISSVPWCHATPAGLGGAHEAGRSNYVDIANEMLDSTWLDVIMGAGHPEFDDDAQPRPTDKRDYKQVGGEETWKALKEGRRDWKLVETKADFESLVSGPTPPKVLGTAQVASTLQEKRGRGQVKVSYDKMEAETPQDQANPPFTEKMNPNVPTLAVMAQGAINCLDDNPKGFYLMIEGGAVDWASHANEPDRLIEEQLAFVEAVEAVVAWVESHGGWDETLVILTADHETGLLWGPDSSKIAFQPLEDRGPEKMPGMRFNSHGHTNSLVPLYTRGPGSQRFAELVKGEDATAAAKRNNSGQYVDNTDVFAVMQAEATGQ